MSRITSFEPLIYQDSRVLVLGSIPSIESLRKRQYYAHDRNHFWQIVAGLFGEATPSDYEGRKTLLRKHRIGLWDVIASCTRRASADSEIKAVKLNDIRSVYQGHAGIERIVCNGKASYRLFEKYFQDCRLPVGYVPSSSPAYAKPLSWKIREWKRKFFAERVHQ